jgi:sugar phosphate isomerase/epimerase
MPPAGCEKPETRTPRHRAFAVNNERTTVHLGIFAKTFARPALEDVLDAVVGHGFDCIQFNFACAGLPSMPERIDPVLADQICSAMAKRNLRMAAVSGTFNMIHPDRHERREGLRRLSVLVSSCRRLGTSTVTLCTGTRDPENMWRRHRDNDSNEAWRDLLETLSQALSFTEPTGVILAIEPEVANVVDSALKARRLLDELRTPRLKVVMDGANLFHTGELPRMKEIMDEAFQLLGPDIVLAHAKDVLVNGTEVVHGAAGTGLLNYDHYMTLLHQAGFNGPLILHSLAEGQVRDAVTFLRGKFQT